MCSEEISSVKNIRKMYKGTGTYLRHVHLPLIPHEKCPVEGVHPKFHLCAGVLKGGKDACQVCIVIYDQFYFVFKCYTYD